VKGSQSSKRKVVGNFIRGNSTGVTGDGGERRHTSREKLAGPSSKLNIVTGGRRRIGERVEKKNFTPVGWQCPAVGTAT